MGELQRVAVQRPAAPILVGARATHARAQRRESEPSPAVLQRMKATRALQPALMVGPANDPFEREAERTADSVMNSPERAPAALGASSIAASLMRIAQRVIGKGEPPTKKDDDERKQHVQKASLDGGRAAETVPAGIEASIGRMSAGGEPLSASTRSFFEPRFGYDFSQVRTHSSAEAAGAAAALGARGFTVGDHIFFGAGQYQPDSGAGRHLLAHELTHTIQQQPSARSARLHPASGIVQRDWFPDPRAAALAKLREWADELPPYELLTVVLGRDPITDKPVERNARTSMHAALKIVPDGMAIYDDMEKNKSIEKASQWFDAEVGKLNLSWDGVKALFKQAWDAVDAADLLSPRSVWEKVKAVFAPTVKRVADFAIAVGGKILDFIKKTVLAKLGAWAKEQRGYTLLTFVLGKDPVTDEPVQRTPKTFVKAVLDLVPGGDKIFENLEKAKTIEKTVAWLDDQITKLDLTWEKIKELFRKAWDAFRVPDLLNPLGLIAKIADIFLPPARRVISFAIAVGKKVLEFIFEGAMIIAGPIGLQIVGIVRKIGDTFNKIVEDPVAFVGNLVQAVKLGFQQFGKNIWDHLKTGLIEWLVGTLEGAGLVLPKVWDLKGILSLVLQILGITYAKMRAKLVKVIGEERVAMLERVFGFIKTLVTEGPAAAWQQIVEAIGSLWDMVIGGIKDWAVTKIVTAALTKLVTLFNPAGAVIQAIIATYNTVAFFIERIKQILALVEAIVDSIANIAAGKLSQAANFVERAMARTIPVILGFLARLIGLGDVSGAVKKVISAIQEKVDKGIDAVIKWVVDKAKSLFGGKDKESAENPKWTAGVAGVSADVEAMSVDEKTEEGIGKRVDGWKNKYGFTALKILHKDDDLVIEGAMSPDKPVKSVKNAPTAPVYGALTAGGYGISVFVDKMASKPAGGSQPSVSTDNWKKLGRRRNDNSPGDYYYVRGHLLNHNLGGPGNIWDNLTPLTQVANNRGVDSMLREFENPVKDAVKAGDAVTKFDVKAVYGGASRTADLSAIDLDIKKATKPAERTRLQTLRDVVEQEQYVPTQVTCKAMIKGKALTATIDNNYRGTSLDKYVVAVP